MAEGKYSCSGELGSGFFGNTLLFEDKSSKEIYVAKSFRIKMDGEQRVKHEEKCRDLLNLQHSNLISLIGFYDIEIQYVLMEKLEMDLKHLLDNVPDVSFPIKLSVLSDVGNGLAYLHSLDIVHGDLIPRNVLLSSCFKAKISDVWNLRISDIRPYDFAKMLCAANSPSLLYLPIEDLQNNSEYHTSMDVFAFGKVTLHVLTQIFSSVQHTSEAGSSESCEKCLANLKILLHKDYPDIVTMVTDSIHEDPGSRPTSSDCLATIHSVIKKVEQRQGGMGVASLMIAMEIMSKERKIQELENELSSLKEQRFQTDTLDSRSRDSLQLAAPVDEIKSADLSIVDKNPRWNLSWQKCRSMSFDMSRSIQVVRINDVVYIGGGDAERQVIENEFLVMLFKLSTNNWTVLKKYQAKWFAMTSIDEQLALVGGRNSDRKDVNEVGVLDGESWNISKYSPMPTCRSHCAVVVYKGWMIVAGGTTVDLETLSTVEALNLQDNQWHKMKDAKIQFYSMKSVILDDTWYLMGGYHGHTVSHDVFKVNLERLVSGEGSDAWINLCKTQCFHASPVLMNGDLLAVGGRTSAYQSEDTIYIYDKDKDSWDLLAKLPDTVNNCTSLVVSDTIYIFGGYNGRNRQNSVYRTSIRDYLH